MRLEHMRPPCLDGATGTRCSSCRPRFAPMSRTQGLLCSSKHFQKIWDLTSTPSLLLMQDPGNILSKDPNHPQRVPLSLVSNSSRSSARTIFPGFLRKPGHADNLPCFSYHGVFPAMQDCTVSDYSESHQGGVPLVIYDNSNPELPMTVFSPLNHPMAHQMASGWTHGIIESHGFFGAGIKVFFWIEGTRIST